MESRSNQKNPIKSYTQYLHEQRLDIGSDMDAASAPENSPLQPNVDIVDWKEKFLLNHCKSFHALHPTRINDNTSSLR